MAKAYYTGEYWPETITHNTNEKLLRFVEKSLYLVPLGPRQAEYDVLADTQINEIAARALSNAAEDLWAAILNQDIATFGKAMREGFGAQTSMFPNMMNDQAEELIKKYGNKSLGWKLCGAGGGGDLILVSNIHIDNTLQVSARRAID